MGTFFRPGENAALLKYSFAWIPMVFIAILNGIFRGSVFSRWLSELRAHQISCLTGVLLFFGYTWLVSLKWPLEYTRQALTIAVVWLLLTIAVEFSFGHYVAHHFWSGLFRDYNISLTGYGCSSLLQLLCYQSLFSKFGPHQSTVGVGLTFPVLTISSALNTLAAHHTSQDYRSPAVMLNSLPAGKLGCPYPQLPSRPGIPFPDYPP